MRRTAAALVAIMIAIVLMLAVAALIGRNPLELLRILAEGSIGSENV